MAFFKSKPNLPDGEKARIEYHVQRIAECIGFDRLTLPVLSERSVFYADVDSERRSAEQIMSLVGKHLGHDVGGISLQTLLLQPQKSGGGG